MQFNGISNQSQHHKYPLLSDCHTQVRAVMQLILPSPSRIHNLYFRKVCMNVRSLLSLLKENSLTGIFLKVLVAKENVKFCIHFSS